MTTARAGFPAGSSSVDYVALNQQLDAEVAAKDGAGAPPASPPPAKPAPAPALSPVAAPRSAGSAETPLSPGTEHTIAAFVQHAMAPQQGEAMDTGLDL